MAGHSKFANIKHKKEKEDFKRGKIFTKLAKEITIACKISGSDPNFNPRLRLAISKAKASNMPKDNIEKAIKKGSGEIEGSHLLEVRYEGYGVGGVAVIVDTLTDNKNRTASEIRHAFSKFGGNLGETGSVSWIFDKKGVISVDKEESSEEDIINLALKVGAEDVITTKEKYLVLTDPSSLYEVSDKINLKKDVGMSMIPQNTIMLGGEEREKFINMLNFMDDLDDVQNIYSNIEEI